MIVSSTILVHKILPAVNMLRVITYTVKDIWGFVCHLNEKRLARAKETNYPRWF